MRAEIVSVGTELLLGDTVDTNAAHIGRALAALGIDHFHRQTVGDNLERLVEALTLALARSDTVFTIGGLGPTPDDLTREGVAAALGLKLVEDPTVRRHLEAWFTQRGVQPLGSQFRQAMKPQGAEVLQNPEGTAPGLWLSHKGKQVLMLPGPPNELHALMAREVGPRLAISAGGSIIYSEVLRTVGMGEGAVAETVADLLSGTKVTVAPYAKTGEVHLRLTCRARDAEAGARLLRPVKNEIYARLNDIVYGEGETTLEQAVIGLAIKNSLTLACAESCTGGLLMGRLTAVDGSSKALTGGFVTYTARSKTELVGVAEETVYRTGTVSQETATEMATGARERTRSNIGVSVTGVAGSDPLDEAGGPKPSGLVYIGLSSKRKSQAFKFQFSGSRSTVRARAVSAALALLRREILKLEAMP